MNSIGSVCVGIGALVVEAVQIVASPRTNKYLYNFIFFSATVSPVSAVCIACVFIRFALVLACAGVDAEPPRPGGDGRGLQVPHGTDDPEGRQLRPRPVVARVYRRPQRCRCAAAASAASSYFSLLLLVSPVSRFAPRRAGTPCVTDHRGSALALSSLRLLLLSLSLRCCRSPFRTNRSLTIRPGVLRLFSYIRSSTQSSRFVH